jgi:hypothetical protein
MTERIIRANSNFARRAREKKLWSRRVRDRSESDNTKTSETILNTHTLASGSRSRNNDEVHFLSNSRKVLRASIADGWISEWSTRESFMAF